MEEATTVTNEARRHMFGVWLALGAYVLAFAVFYPQLLTISDETSYMRQAWAYAQGQTSVEVLDPSSLQVARVHPSDYPPGTSLLMAPLMAAGGWRAGFLLGPLACCLVVLLLAHWLGRLGPRHAGPVPLRHERDAQRGAGQPFSLPVLVCAGAQSVDGRGRVCGRVEPSTARNQRAGVRLFLPGKSTAARARMLGPRRGRPGRNGLAPSGA